MFLDDFISEVGDLNSNFLGIVDGLSVLVTVGGDGDVEVGAVLETELVLMNLNALVMVFFKMYYGFIKRR